MGGTEAFPSLGKHCSEDTCHQLDFLPFKCDACLQVFCLEHRSYKSHSCRRADVKDVSVLICPVCASTVRKVFNEDSNLTLERHSRTRCDPSNYPKVMTKPKCPVKGCREVLTFSNKVACKTCRQETCLKHRFPADHSCSSSNIALQKRPVTSVPGGLFLGYLSARSGTQCGSSSNDKTLDQEKGLPLRAH